MLLTGLTHSHSSVQFGFGQVRTYNFVAGAFFRQFQRRVWVVINKFLKIRKLAEFTTKQIQILIGLQFCG